MSFIFFYIVGVIFTGVVCDEIAEQNNEKCPFGIMFYLLMWHVVLGKLVGEFMATGKVTAKSVMSAKYKSTTKQSD